ncbi:hypothetical protein B0H17DRAFT_1150743, partial [Mycena rosella]
MAFPNEIWLRIWSQPSLSPRDLASVCLTSSRALQVARTLLYRSVKIVLVSDFQSSAASFQTLQLLAPTPTWLALTVTLDAFTNLTSLKCLNLLGGIFAGEAISEEAKDAFVDALADLPLEKLNIRTYGFFNFLGLSATQLERFKNLKNLEWRPDAPDHGNYAPLWSLLSSSASSLTSLSLPFGTDSEAAHHDLFTMRFPRLQSLILGNWSLDIQTPSDFNSFIIAHSDTLEHLDLGYCNYDEYNLSFADDGTFTPNTLHRLREFRGHTDCVLLMAKSRMTCLASSLTKLTVGPGGVDSPTWEVRGMFDVLRASGGLGALKELDLDLQEWEEREREDIKEVVAACAQVCPSLEIWSGTPGYSLTWTAEQLGTLFGKFGKLRLIRLLDSSVDGDTDR